MTSSSTITKRLSQYLYLAAFVYWRTLYWFKSNQSNFLLHNVWKFLINLPRVIKSNMLNVHFKLYYYSAYNSQLCECTFAVFQFILCSARIQSLVESEAILFRVLRSIETRHCRRWQTRINRIRELICVKSNDDCCSDRVKYNKFLINSNLNSFLYWLCQLCRQLMHLQTSNHCYRSDKNIEALFVPSDINIYNVKHISAVGTRRSMFEERSVHYYRNITHMYITVHLLCISVILVHVVFSR